MLLVLVIGAVVGAVWNEDGSYIRDVFQRGAVGATGDPRRRDGPMIGPPFTSSRAARFAIPYFEADAFCALLERWANSY